MHSDSKKTLIPSKEVRTPAQSSYLITKDKRSRENISWKTLIYQENNLFLASSYFLDNISVFSVFSYRHLVLFLPEGLNAILP